METYVQAVEKQVRAAPQDWLWFYKRWKYRREEAKNPVDIGPLSS